MEGKYLYRIEVPEQSSAPICYLFDPSELRKVPLKIHNLGTEVWDSKDKTHPTFLGYHLLDSNEGMIRFDNARTSFPYQVLPQESVTLELAIQSPETPGCYILEVDLVKEGVTWFKEKGVETVHLPLIVTDREPLAKGRE